MNYWLLLIFLLCCACQSEEKASDVELLDLPTSLLIFKVEQRLEIWQDGAIKKYSFNNKIPLHIGRYEWQNETIFNEKDTFLLNEVLETTIDFDTFSGIAFIFPNDARSDDNFLPCLRCPHTAAALYSQLWLHLQPYSNSTTTIE